MLALTLTRACQLTHQEGWVRRYQESGEAGLMDRSRRPHHSPRRTPPAVEEQVLSLTDLLQFSRDKAAEMPLPWEAGSKNRQTVVPMK